MVGRDVQQDVDVVEGRVTLAELRRALLGVVVGADDEDVEAALVRSDAGALERGLGLFAGECDAVADVALDLLEGDRADRNAADQDDGRADGDRLEHEAGRATPAEATVTGEAVGGSGEARRGGGSLTGCGFFMRSASGTTGALGAVVVAHGGPFLRRRRAPEPGGSDAVAGPESVPQKSRRSVAARVAIVAGGPGDLSSPPIQLVAIGAVVACPRTT